MADDTFYLWQIEAFGNACGSIAAVHSVAANYLQGTFELQPGPLKTFIDDCKGAHPGEIGVKLADAKGIVNLQHFVNPKPFGCCAPVQPLPAI